MLLVPYFFLPVAVGEDCLDLRLRCLPRAALVLLVALHARCDALFRILLVATEIALLSLPVVALSFAAAGVLLFARIEQCLLVPVLGLVLAGGALRRTVLGTQHLAQYTGRPQLSIFSATVESAFVVAALWVLLPAIGLTLERSWLEARQEPK